MQERLLQLKIKPTEHFKIFDLKLLFSILSLAEQDTEKAGSFKKTYAQRQAVVKWLSEKYFTVNCRVLTCCSSWTASSQFLSSFKTCKNASSASENLWKTQMKALNTRCLEPFLPVFQMSVVLCPSWCPPPPPFPGCPCHTNVKPFKFMSFKSSPCI